MDKDEKIIEIALTKEQILRLVSWAPYGTFRQIVFFACLIISSYGFLHETKWYDCLFFIYALTMSPRIIWGAGFTVGWLTGRFLDEN